MSALDHPSLLERLIVRSELALQMRTPGESEDLADLAERLNLEFHKPAEDGRRVIGPDTMIAMEALRAAADHIRGHDRASAARYLRVLGVLMPEIREALSSAIDKMRRPTA